jgi:ribonuclease E
LGQYTVISLIRHVYGEDCSVLIEQFGLIPTFNRALVKFTEQYAATLSVQATEAEIPAQPVTRDVAVTKAAPEAEPAPVLDLTPPKPVSDKRVANDPRERRRLAKQAAEQALEQAKQAHNQPETAPAETVAVTEAETPTAEVAEPEVTQAVVEPVVTEVATEAVAEPAAETVAAPVETEQAAEPVQAELAVEAAQQDVQTQAEATAEAEKTEGEETDKPVRPRRPRGRPPKKATSANES